MTGDDILFIKSVQAGAAGIISVAGNLVPILMKELMCNESIPEKTLNTWNHLIQTLRLFPNPQGVKLVLGEQLKKPFVCRAFLSKFHEKERDLLFDMMEKYMKIEYF